MKTDFDRWKISLFALAMPDVFSFAGAKLSFAGGKLWFGGSKLKLVQVACFKSDTAVFMKRLLSL